MSDELDNLARTRASGRITRRRALRLLVGASSTAVIGGALGERLTGAMTSPTQRRAGAGYTSTNAGAETKSASATMTLRDASEASGSNMCPLPNILRPLTSTSDCPSNRVPKSNYSPTFNGCGSKGFWGYAVPDVWGKATFTPACNTHDICYGTCGADKAACDVGLREDIVKICLATYSRYDPLLQRCIDLAYIYESAVEDTLVGGHIGRDAYAEGQKEGCDCCEPTTSTCVQCNCTGEVFTNELECINNCDASITCFTGICGPVSIDMCSHL